MCLESEECISTPRQPICLILERLLIEQGASRWKQNTENPLQSENTCFRCGLNMINSRFPLLILHDWAVLDYSIVESLFNQSTGFYRSISPHLDNYPAHNLKIMTMPYKSWRVIESILNRTQNFRCGFMTDILISSFFFQNWIYSVHLFTTVD